MTIVDKINIQKKNLKFHIHIFEIVTDKSNVSPDPIFQMAIGFWAS
jgi:hypothetical protein